MILAPPPLPPPARDLFLPLVGSKPQAVPASGPCAMTDRAAQLAVLILALRPGMRCDMRLVRAAQAKADDQSVRGWWSHDSPEGISPNAWVRSFGVRLPDEYLADGNAVESLAYNFATAEDVLAALLASPGHAAHIRGDGWFGGQDLLGVGVAVGNGIYWVVLTASEGEG